MSAREPLSVVVITRNEERNLDRCLASVVWAEERVVVDSGSTDRTVAVARRRGARVVEQPWLGFTEQKNRAVREASHRWVLSLDADEWLDAEAAEAVREALAVRDAEAYALNRRSALAGGFVDHAWSRDWQIRLFDRERGRFSGGPVHESVRLDPGSRVGRLRGRLLHLSYRSVAEYVERMNRYTDLAAEGLALRGRRVPWARLLVSPPATFLKLWVVRGGFLDGPRGLVVAAGSAFYVFLKYVKLWERTRPPDRRFEAVVPPTTEDPVPSGKSSEAEMGRLSPDSEGSGAGARGTPSGPPPTSPPSPRR